MIDGERSVSSSSDSSSIADESLIVSQSSYDRKMVDLDLLNKEKFPLITAIEAARELGDLRENAEYQMAKDEQKVLLARQAELQSDLMRAKPTDFTDAPSDSVGIGSVVNLSDAKSVNDKSMLSSVLGTVIRIITFCLT